MNLSSKNNKVAVSRVISSSIDWTIIVPGIYILDIHLMNSSKNAPNNQQYPEAIQNLAPSSN